MRLAFRLLAERNPEWAQYYCSYSVLKHSLAEAETSEHMDAWLVAVDQDLAHTLDFFVRTVAHCTSEIKRLQQQANALDRMAWTECLRATQDLRLRLIDTYVQVHLLDKFSLINDECFAKLMKKLSKRSSDSASASEETVARIHSRIVAKPFSSDAHAVELTQLATTLEPLFAKAICGDNIHVATEQLKSALKRDERMQVRAIETDMTAKRGWIIDCDGVLYYQNKLLPGAADFIQWLKTEKKEFVLLTNSSERTPREIVQKLARLGIHVSAEQVHTSALSTASFLKEQCPNGTCYAIGDAGLITALHDVGFTMNAVDPDYVVIGETQTFCYEHMRIAINCVYGGARLIATNIDKFDRSTDGVLPGTACIVEPIQVATGQKAYYLGKPNPIMMRTARQKLNVASSDTVVIGDRMDTDIIGGLEAGMHTILVLSGVTRTVASTREFNYRPNVILGSIADILAVAHADD